MSSFAEANTLTAPAYAIMHPERARSRKGTAEYGSDISDAIEKLIEWMKTLDVENKSKETLDMVYHFVINYILPWARELVPDKYDRLLDYVLPFLKVLHDKWLHATV